MNEDEALTVEHIQELIQEAKFPIHVNQFSYDRVSCITKKNFALVHFVSDSGKKLVLNLYDAHQILSKNNASASDLQDLQGMAQV